MHRHEMRWWWVETRWHETRRWDVMRWEDVRWCVCGRTIVEAGWGCTSWWSTSISYSVLCINHINRFVSSRRVYATHHHPKRAKIDRDTSPTNGLDTYLALILYNNSWVSVHASIVILRSSLLHPPCWFIWHTGGGKRRPRWALAANKISEVRLANVGPLGHETVKKSNYP